MTISLLLKFVVTMFGSLGFWELLKYLISSRKTKKTAEAEGILALLHNELYPVIEKVYFRGKVGYEEFDNLTHLYEPYIKLGGNSTLKRRYEDIAKFERIKDSEIDLYDNHMVIPPR